MRRLSSCRSDERIESVDVLGDACEGEEGEVDEVDDLSSSREREVVVGGVSSEEGLVVEEGEEVEEVGEVRTRRRRRRGTSDAALSVMSVLGVVLKAEHGFCGRCAV